MRFSPASTSRKPIYAIREGARRGGVVCAHSKTEGRDEGALRDMRKDTGMP